MEGQGEPPNQRAALPLAAAPDAAPTVPGGRRDYFGRLPDHLLLRILLRLSTEEAAQTSVLSQRWRGVWAQLPRLEFYHVESSVPARALAVYGELDIESLTVYSNQMDCQSTASWLSLAAPRLSGMLYFDNNHTVSQETMQSFLHEDDNEAVMQRGSFELPCFKKATAIRMDLGFLGLALPPAGVFDALRVMRLVNFWSRDQFGISDTVLPSLQEFFIRRVRGLTVLTLKSKSLLDIHLSFLPQLQNLDIVSPSLNKLEVTFCFYDVPESRANIAAERLEILRWEVPCVPDTVNLRKMSSIWVLGAPPVSTLWQETISAEFLNCFQAVDNLELDMIFGVSSSSLLQYLIVLSQFHQILEVEKQV
ncbi:putative F-box/FBD/LRR-repeat protein At4g03220 [Lolium rigidum]|uniref:putative F-box/FBD/LRR-repeat protein At4g03220 n=1 Tax=Lolium rigidum TaxID=89674 RepID=UPI001F5E1A7E|nr:putative F-box/FBD/LRR-repeat protein At4g03220 [Lolium rigidum]